MTAYSGRAADLLAMDYCPVPAHGPLGGNGACAKCGGTWEIDGDDFATLSVRPTRGYQFMLSQIDADPGRVDRALTEWGHK